MKRYLCLFALFFLFFPVYSQQYKILEYSYSIEGSGKMIKTQEYALIQQVPIDTKTIFKDVDSFNTYISNLNTKLNNLRAFETVQISYEPIEVPDTPESDIIFIKLLIYVKDSFHLFAIPGPKYDSNKGLTLKVKLTDSNFLGSLNTLSSDFYLLLPTEESDGKTTEFGFNCNVDYPFKAGIFDAVWLNSLKLSYTLEQPMPEWNIHTGLRLTLPFEKTKLIFETNQRFINNFQYKDFNDNLYFVNDFKFFVPLIITQLNYFGNLTYTPYSTTSINWDFNYISEENSDLSSPITTIGHTLSFGRTDWNKNLRTGFNFSLDNSYTYNFQRKRFYPQITMDITAFKTFDLFQDSYFFRNLGINSHIRAFTYLYNPKKNNYIDNDGNPIGQYLRGIRDYQEYKEVRISALNPTNAFILNLDFPIHIFTTNFTKSFFKYFNFDFQLSPFFDMALCYNKITQTYFSFEDGFYGTGIEIIVYPAKWSGITLRGSVGIDAGRKFFANHLNMDWRENVSKKEFSVGFGLHY